MNIKRNSIVNIIILILSLLFIGISFADFYEITITGSVLDSYTGDYSQSIEYATNSLTSIVLTVVSTVCLIFKKKWIIMISIFVSSLNFLIIALIFPFLISALSIIGASYSARLTELGWIGLVIVLIIIFLLISKTIHKRKVVADKQRGVIK